MDDRAIPVTCAWLPAQKEKKYYTLPISVTVPAPSLTLLPQGEGSQAKATIYVGVVDDSGYTRDIGREEATYTLPKDAPANASLNYVVRLQTRKGNQRIVVNVQDAQTGRMGTAKADVRVQ